jgi:hypothetical protein
MANPLRPGNPALYEAWVNYLELPDGSLNPRHSFTHATDITGRSQQQVLGFHYRGR